MKRIILLTISLMLAVTMTSCLSSDNHEIEPTRDGWFLYRPINSTNILALDPMHIAFRLNVLLTEASKYTTDKPLDEVTVVVDKKDANLKEILFGYNNVSTLDKEAGIYEIKFSQTTTSAIGKSDMIRVGTVVIETSGKLLTKLTSGEAWAVYAKGEDGYKIYPSLNSYTNVILPVYDKAGGENAYLISGVGESEWKLQLEGFKAYSYADYPSEWNVDFTLRHFPTVVVDDDKDKDKDKEGDKEEEQEQKQLPLDYADASTCTFELSGESYGRPIFNSYGHYWESTHKIIRALKIKPACGNMIYYYGGEEKVEVELPIENTQFPSPRVTIEWGEQTNSECKQTSVIHYNGHVYPPTY